MKQKQMSESIFIVILLALSGGFMDAYSYLYRGHVFANAQTGNILLMGIYIAKGSYINALQYAFPVFAFTVGIAIADFTRLKLKERKGLHWRQLTIFLEAIVLLFVSFLPQSENLLANSMTSFACGIQVETFRKINGYGIATTMCIGNLRTATQSLMEFFHSHKKEEGKKGLLFYGVILFFVLGAILGNFSVEIWQERAIIVCDLFLLFGFLLMFLDLEKKEMGL